MPRGTEWVGGVCPTTLSERGNDVLTAWIDGGITGELRGDVEGHGGLEHGNGGPWGPIRGGRAPVVAGLVAYGPGGTRNEGHTAPEVAGLGGVQPRRLQDGPTDIESLRQEASGTASAKKKRNPDADVMSSVVPCILYAVAQAPRLCASLT